jgi:hypothetical protein
MIKITDNVLGELSYDKGPQNINSWTGILEGGKSSDNEIFTIILEQENLEAADKEFIRRIVENWKYYVDKSLGFIKEKVISNPEIFEINDEENKIYANMPIADMPVELPEFIFWENHKWCIKFNYGRFPVCEPFGIGVFFYRENPIEIEGLSDAVSMG